jgi:hypothetical protein
MRHGLTGVLVALGLGLFGLERVGESSEPLDNRLGLRIQPIFLLTRVDVQTDLSLLPDQIADANRVGAELYRKAQLLRGKKGPAVDEERRKIDYELTRWLVERLTVLQFERLREIDLQWEGASAMVRPIEAEYLGLSLEQQKKVRQYLEESFEQRERGAPWTASDHFELNRRAVALLSDNQKERWADLLGKPCQFSYLGQKPATIDPRSARGTDRRQQPGR